MVSSEGFDRALELIKLFVEIPANREYDGIIVKQLSSTNTLDANRSQKQTHIAITGGQMLMFPYLKSEAYFDCEYQNRNDDFKKYLFLRIPLYIYKSNVNKIEGNTLFERETADVVKAFCSVVRSRRSAQSEQLQLSLITQDSPEFLAFRRMLHTGDYLVICKIKGRVEYDCFGVKGNDAISGDNNIEELNNKFFYLPTVTAVDESDMVIGDVDASNDWLEKLWEDLSDETLENKTWIFLCLEKLKEYGVLTSDVLKILCDFKYCKDNFKLYNTPVLVKEVDDSNSNRVYANEKFVLNGEEQFFVSKEWKNQDGNRNRIDFTNWVIRLISKKFRDLTYKTNVTSKYSLNHIIFGAPGTGKSNLLETERKDLLGNTNNYERVTFHPDYTYANFVGTYKPVPAKDENGKEIITYKYVPGPFMRMLVKALLNSEQPYLLLIEEINRANVAAVFGDVFQLLDRDADGVSEYEIQTSEDMRRYLADELCIDVSKVENIKIPNNLYLWATMNSADQGVYPMDTAFKRRWDFEYLDIDNGEDQIDAYTFEVADEDAKQEIHWNSLRKAINKALIDNNINEDKLMGAFFVSKNIIDAKNNDKFVAAFCNKVIMYLFEDAARQKQGRIFNIDDKNGVEKRYSSLCNAFKKKGIDIFVKNIVDKYDELVAEKLSEQ